ncbi:hypothetical protein IFM61392_03086, partial [Aspergillus lentulus]
LSFRDVSLWQKFLVLHRVYVDVHHHRRHHKVRRGLLRQGRQVRRCLTRVLPLPQIRPRARQYHPPPPPVPGFSAVDVKNPDVQRLLTSLPRYITNIGGNGVQGLLFPFRRSSSASAPPLPPRPKARKGHDSYIIISNY